MCVARAPNEARGLKSYGIFAEPACQPWDSQQNTLQPAEIPQQMAPEDLGRLAGYAQQNAPAALQQTSQEQPFIFRALGNPLVQGALAIMVGGEEKVFNESMEIFKALGKNIVRVGGIGAGGFVKLVNQIIVAVNIAAVGEAFTLGAKASLNPQVIHQAIRGGLAGSSVLETKAPMMFERNFKPGFKIRLHHKDLQNALSTAKDLGVPLPLSSFVQQIFLSLMTEGRGEEDHSALATFFEKMAKVEIKSK